MDSKNELQHHGIFGMKWGQRNGPPYPLSYAQKNVAEKRARSGGYLKPAVNSAKKQFANNVAQRTSQKVINKAVGYNTKKEELEKVAKDILKGAAVVAATGMLASLIQNLTYDAVEVGKETAKNLLFDFDMGNIRMNSSEIKSLIDQLRIDGLFGF